MPLIPLDENFTLVVPKEHRDLLGKTEGLTKKIVDLINNEDEDYGVNAASLAFATLIFLQSARELDEEASEEIRSAILEIVSEGR